MKYLDKLTGFINDLSKTIPYIGSMCCPTCAIGKHKEKELLKSFWINGDDWNNQARQGVDLNIIYSEDSCLFDTVSQMITLAKKHNLSFFMSLNKDYRVRTGVYSKRGKQEIKFYRDGEDVTENILPQVLAESK